MANQYRSDGFNTFPRDPANTVGQAMRSIFYQKTITSAAATAADVFILAGPFSGDDKIAAIRGATPAFTTATSNDLGFWKSLDGGATFVPVSTAAATCLWSAVDLSSAKTYQELLGTVNTTLDRTKNIAALCNVGSTGSDAEVFGGYYLGLRMNTATTATTSDLKLEIVAEEANTK